MNSESLAGQLHAPPYYAPLPRPFIDIGVQALSESKGVQEMLRHAPVSVSPTVYADQAVEQYRRIWALFLQRVQEARMKAYSLMERVVKVYSPTREPYVPPGWLRRQLTELVPQAKSKEEPITGQTIWNWSQKNILRYIATEESNESKRSHGWGRLNAHISAGVLSLRLMDDTHERFSLPPTVSPEEPYFWAWSQSIPVRNGREIIQQPWIQVPIPLPSDLPPTTLIWTHWPGAAWDPAWVQIKFLGAIRFAGTTLDEHGNRIYSLSKEELSLWDPTLFSLDMGFLESTQEMINGGAYYALLRLALDRLRPNLPIV
jgi:hypothetical protein